MIKLDYTNRYCVDQILTEFENFYLQNLYKNREKKNSILKNESFYGLANRSHFKTHDYELEIIIDKLLHYAIDFNKMHGKDTNLTLRTMYFQEYLKNSHLPEHKDGFSENGVTLVTLVDRSEDLIGGDLLIIDKMHTFKKEHNLTDIHKDPYTRLKDFENTNIYVLLPQEIGETAVYISGTIHSISKILNGNRLVLVTWFDTKKST